MHFTVFFLRFIDDKNLHVNSSLIACLSLQASLSRTQNTELYCIGHNLHVSACVACTFSSLGNTFYFVLCPSLSLSFYNSFSLCSRAAHAAAQLVDFIVWNYRERANMTPFTRSLVTCRNNYFPAKIAQSAEKCMDERERKKKEGKKQAWQEEKKRKTGIKYEQAVKERESRLATAGKMSRGNM